MDRYILFSAPVNPAIANAFVALLDQLRMENATKVVITMNCPGGDVVAGIHMYNMMLAMPYEIEAHNVGNVDSIGNVIFLGAAKRYANSPSTFMFHGVGFESVVGERLEEKNLLEKLDAVESSNQRASAIISARTGLNAEACMMLFKDQKTRDASWAKDNRLVHDVRDFALPTDAVTHHFMQS